MKKAYFSLTLYCRPAKEDPDMKKLAVLMIFLIVLSLLLISCRSEEEAPKTFSEMTLEEILAAIYQKGGYSKQLTELIEAPVPNRIPWISPIIL